MGFCLYVCNKHEALDLFYSFVGSLFHFVCSLGMKLKVLVCKFLIDKELVHILDLFNSTKVSTAIVR
jgi:hypothetical protein